MRTELGRNFGDAHFVGAEGASVIYANLSGKRTKKTTFSVYMFLTICVMRRSSFFSGENRKNFISRIAAFFAIVSNAFKPAAFIGGGIILSCDPEIRLESEKALDEE